MRGVDSVSLGHDAEEHAGRVRKGSGPRVMAVLRNLIIDLCLFSATASLAAGPVVMSARCLSSTTSVHRPGPPSPPRTERVTMA